MIKKLIAGSMYEMAPCVLKFAVMNSSFLHNDVTFRVETQTFLRASVSLQAASEPEHCITKREQEKCMERITLHNPSDNLELGRRWCVAEGFYANVNINPKVVCGW